MANTDNTSIQMHQRLKQLFPEIPDNIIYNQAVHQFPHDLQRCIEVLKRYRHRQAFLTEDLTKSYGNKGAYVHQNQKEYVTPFQRHDVRGHVNGVSSPPTACQNQVRGRWLPAPYSSPSGVRSVSVSGVSPVAPSTAASGYHSTSTTTSQQHPQSAPVMPSHYEPFHLEYQGVVNPSTGQIQMKVPDTAYSLHRGAYIDQLPRFGYNYEMHVQYKEQRAQKDRLHHKLSDDKQKLDELRADIMAMEEELKLRREQRCSQDPLFNMHEEIRQLRDITSRLRIECHRMSKEVDELGEVPLGETSLDFYTNINPGQCGSVGVPPTHPEPTSTSMHSAASQLPCTVTNREHDDDQQWSCSACTFLNNGALNKCEMCDMPRFSTATSYA